MFESRHEADILVRFWRSDHSCGDEILWPPSPWPSLIYADGGILRVIAENRWYLLPSYRALWISPGVVYARRASGVCRVRSLYFSPQLGVIRLPGPLDVSLLLHALVVAACSEGPLKSTCERHRAMAQLLGYEIEKAPAEAVFLPLPSDPHLRRVASQFCYAPGSLDDMADEAGLSRRTLERKFQEEVGISLGQWAMRVRAMNGMRALADGLTIGEAAVDSGYGSASAFCQVFKRIFGETPGKWRERNCG